MSGKDASGPNISLIALVVIGIIFLAGFYYADRTSSPEEVTASNPSSGNSTSDSSILNEMEEKHRRAIAADNRPGFSGSMEEYLNHAELVESAKELTAKGFSGTGDEYLQKGAVSRSVEDVDGVTATGQSLEDYLAGGSSSASSTKKSASSKSKDTSSSGASRSVEEVDGVTATAQSIDDYLASAKPGNSYSSSSKSTSSSNKKSSASNESKEPFSGTMDAYLDKY